MSDIRKTLFAAPQPKTAKPKRPTTASMTSNTKTPQLNSKKPEVPQTSKIVKPKCAKNITSTSILEADVTINDNNYEDEYKQISYGRFLRSMLKDCLIDEKIEREETEIDIQMAKLAARCDNSVELLDKTHRRIKDISFILEQKRLLDLKNKDCTQFYDLNQTLHPEELLEDLHKKEKNVLDRLETKNVDFGFTSASGHQQLIDALNESIKGLEDIKKQSNLDIGKFEEYEKTKKMVENVEENTLELERLKKEFETKFPDFSERVLKEATEMVSKMIESDSNDEGF